MNKLGILIFSRDRAMQLDATLRSFFKHCRNASDYPIHILFKATNEQHSQQYTQLIKEFQSFRNIHFIHERNFRKDVLNLLSLAFNPDLRRIFFQWFVKSGYRFRNLAEIALNIRPGSQVLFLVDDNLFVRHFDLQEAVVQLENLPEAIGFSLRLGQNTTFCYPKNMNQLLPEFSRTAPGILEYNWHTSQDDFGFPLEVSSSIFRLEDVLPTLIQGWFATPNQMETCLARSRAKFPFKQKLLCFDQSVTFCNPINMVQTEYQNRAGSNPSYSSDQLADIFNLGGRIDIEAFDGFIPNGCHQEVPLKFT